MKIYITILFFISFCCYSTPTKNIQTCEFYGGYKVQLVSRQTVDGDSLYLKFKEKIMNAFSDGDDSNSGEVVLAKCINHALIFSLNYGSPYLKGCLITESKKTTNNQSSLDRQCFSEKNTPESVWFGKYNTLIVIYNSSGIGEWSGRYIIYDNAREDAYASNVLPKKTGYDIYYIKSN